MLELKNKAFELRKLGKSYRAISSELGVPIGTLSLWLSDQAWSREIGKSLKSESSKKGSARLAAARKARGFGLQFSYAKAKQDAEVEYKKLKKDRLFLSGLTLYWAMGDQASKYYVRLTTADMHKMALFIRFLQDSLGVEVSKAKCALTLPYSANEQDAMEIWSSNAKIPLQCFTKSSFRRKNKKKTENMNPVCSATLSSRYHKEKMLVWLRLVANEFLAPTTQ